MLKEVSIIEGAKAITKGKKVYAVNLNTEERCLVDFSELIKDVRLLVDCEDDARSIEPSTNENPKPKRKYTRKTPAEKGGTEQAAEEP